MTKIVTEVPLTPDRYGTAGKWESPLVIRTHSRYARHAVRLKLGYIDPTGSARQVTAGPLVPGPWCFAFPLPTVIDNFGGTGAERARLQAQGLEVDAEVGDRFLLDGRTWELRDDRALNYPTLVEVVEG